MVDRFSVGRVFLVGGMDKHAFVSWKIQSQVGL